MSMNMKVWRIQSDKTLHSLDGGTLATESMLEDWIERDPSLLGMDILIIGRQVSTANGGRIDLLGLDGEANTVVIELKKGQTPRDVVAQVLDYASYVRRFTYQELDEIAKGHIQQDLASAFAARFESSIPETVNPGHRLVIVASELDDSSERIVEYLAEQYEMNINVVFFNVFEDTQGQILGRAWLMDPEDVEERATNRHQAPWSGYWFVNVGDGDHRKWEDNIEYGYVGAGHGVKYAESLKKLKAGNRIFAYMKGCGYVGYGIVKAPAVPVREFRIGVGKQTLADASLKAAHALEFKDDPQHCEWAVRVEWQKTYDRDHPQTFKGIFANQNIVCKLRHAKTVEFLTYHFGVVE